MSPETLNHDRRETVRVFVHVIPRLSFKARFALVEAALRIISEERLQQRELAAVLFPETPQ